jgi:hypothetical protein
MEEGVSHSLVLVAAALLAGQVTITPVSQNCASCAAANQQAVYSSPYGESSSVAPRSLFGRLRSLLHPSVQTAAYAVPAGAKVETVPAGASAEPPMVTTAEPPQEGAVDPSGSQSPMPELNKKYKDQIGYGENYSWVTGQLFYLHTSDGGVWVVRYAGIDQVDPHGGSIVLTAGVDMKNYREGDLVCVEGRILADRAAPGHLRGAVYQPTSISMITRTDY